MIASLQSSMLREAIKQSSLSNGMVLSPADIDVRLEELITSINIKKLGAPLLSGCVVHNEIVTAKEYNDIMHRLEFDLSVGFTALRILRAGLVNFKPSFELEALGKELDLISTVHKVSHKFLSRVAAQDFDWSSAFNVVLLDKSIQLDYINLPTEKEVEFNVSFISGEIITGTLANIFDKSSLLCGNNIRLECSWTDPIMVSFIQINADPVSAVTVEWSGDGYNFYELASDGKGKWVLNNGARGFKIKTSGYVQMNGLVIRRSSHAEDGYIYSRPIEVNNITQLALSSTASIPQDSTITYWISEDRTTWEEIEPIETNPNSTYNMGSVSTEEMVINPIAFDPPSIAFGNRTLYKAIELDADKEPTLTSNSIELYNGIDQVFVEGYKYNWVDADSPIKESDMQHNMHVAFNPYPNNAFGYRSGLVDINGIGTTAYTDGLIYYDNVTEKHYVRISDDGTDEGLERDTNYDMTYKVSFVIETESVSYIDQQSLDINVPDDCLFQMFVNNELVASNDTIYVDSTDKINLVYTLNAGQNLFEIFVVYYSGSYSPDSYYVPIGLDLTLDAYKMRGIKSPLNLVTMHEIAYQTPVSSRSFFTIAMIDAVYYVLLPFDPYTAIDLYGPQSAINALELNYKYKIDNTVTPVIYIKVELEGGATTPSIESLDVLRVI